jgi:diguanylate cyclase (GGDEF)-like protein
MGTAAFGLGWLLSATKFFNGPLKDMISIKKYLDEKIKPKTGQNADILGAFVNTYRSGIVAVARATALDETPHGVELGNRLVGLDHRLSIKPSVESVREAAVEFEANLALWSKRAAAESKAKDSEIRELIVALAKTAELLLSHNHEKASQFGALTGHLERIGSLGDIAQIRNGLVQRVAELRASIEQMNQENRELVSGLQTKVTTFETRLKSVENLALTDALTGLANRRCLEDRMVYNTEHGVVFCVAIFDLNRFKVINDTFGHLAGDDLLRQFAERLKQNSRATDLIGRWGGDEFILLLTGDEEKARPLVKRLQSQVCARYMLHGSDGFYSSWDVEASAGLAQWLPQESVRQVVARADEDMYRDKNRMKNAKTAESLNTTVNV